VWFHSFILDYAEITEPLSRLTRKEVEWEWGNSQEEAIAALQHAITTAPCLRYFDSELKTEVFTDASDHAVGGWIGQHHQDGLHPVVFWSRKLTPTELNYPVHEKELLGLVAMLEKHSYLLHGVKFTCNTDHESIKYLQTQQHLSRRQMRWVILLQDFDFNIKYIKGELNNVADLLSRSANVQLLFSRCQEEIQQVKINVVIASENKPGTKPISLRERILSASKDDSDWKKIEEEKLWNFVKRGGLWYFGTRLFVPKAVVQNILSRYHDSSTAGHQGVTTTSELISRRFYWPGMFQDIKHWIRSCDVCQRFQKPNQGKSGFMQPIQIPKSRFCSVSMDFFHLPQSKNGNSL
jgi:RNase H-like domain found in reverse transcriptase/Integrase zinc binding domain